MTMAAFGQCGFAAIFGIVFLGAVRAAEPAAAVPPKRDLHSFGNPEQIRVSRVVLDLTPDFRAKRAREGRRP